MKKWEDRKDLVFSHMYLVEGVEKWESGKLFYFVGKKKERMENVNYINWLLCPYYIIVEKWKEYASVIKWGYLCKMYYSSLFPPHFPPNLGG